MSSKPNPAFAVCLIQSTKLVCDVHDSLGNPKPTQNNHNHQGQSALLLLRSPPITFIDVEIEACFYYHTSDKNRSNFVSTFLPRSLMSVCGLSVGVRGL